MIKCQPPFPTIQTSLRLRFTAILRLQGPRNKFDIPPRPKKRGGTSMLLQSRQIHKYPKSKSQPNTHRKYPETMESPGKYPGNRKSTGKKMILNMDVSKNNGTPKMDGENNGSNPMNKWRIWGVKNPYFLVQHPYFCSWFHPDIL